MEAAEEDVRPISNLLTVTRKYLLRRYILGVLTHTTALILGRFLLPLILYG